MHALPAADGTAQPAAHVDSPHPGVALQLRQQGGEPHGGGDPNLEGDRDPFLVVEAA